MRTMIRFCTLHLVWSLATLLAVALEDQAPGHCSWPPRLNFAQLADEHQEKNLFPVGSSVRYTCRPGYIKSPGLKYTSTCLPNQTWSNIQELCQRRKCEHPGEPANGRLVVSGDFLLSSTVNYLCEDGYKMIGPSSRRCVVHDSGVQWTGSIPVCQRIQCLPPPEIPHGTHSGRYAIDFSYGSVVIYTCEDGYPLVGDAHIYCTSKDGINGEWSGRAYCGVTECPPPEVENGRIVVGTSKTYRYNQSVTLECNNGHKMSGSREIRCQMDGKWEPALPLCERVGGCGAPEIQNGRIIGAQDNYKPMGAITFECDPGYVLKGNHTIECQIDNTWDPPVPVCVREVRCQPPPEVPNGSHSNQGATAFTAEMVVKYTCDPGYALIGEATIHCTSSGTWSSPAPLCEGGACGPAVRLEFAELLDEYRENNSFPIGSTVKYSCRPGYFRVPGMKPSLTCLRDQEWSEVQEFCKRKSCGHPGEPNNGRLIVSGDFLFGSTINYSCDEGHQLLGTSSRSCVISGKKVQWTGAVPFCEQILCYPPPKIPHGTHSGRYAEEFPYGTIITYTCEDGYPLVGDTDIYCTSKDGINGEWSGRAYCGVTECPPPEVENGKIVSGVSKTYRYNQSVTLECNNGHKMSGSREIHCQMEGKWEPPLPLCERVGGCGAPEIQNGRIIGAQDNYKPMGAITFECDPGYVLKGNHTIECQDDNTWDPPVPVCVREVRCQPPPEVPNGSHSNQEATAFTAEMVVKYTCDPGYALIGEATVHCTSSGTWSSPAPLCEGGACGPAVRLEFAELLDEYRENNSFPIGSTVKYSCRPGYFRVPGMKPSLTCLRDQEWSEVQEFCKRKSCGHPGEPNNGRLMVSGDFLFGSTVNYRCEEGHWLLGNSSRRCEILGRRVQWTGDLPLCQRILCSPPPEIPHGTHSGRYMDDFSYGSVITYTCEDSYPLVGDAHIYCTSKDGINGEWSGRAYCGVSHCPLPPDITNGKHNRLAGEIFTPHMSVTYSCDPGHLLIGKASISCTASGAWSLPLPRCEEIQCQSPPLVSNGSHSNEEAKAFSSGMSVKYTCDPGFTLNGEPTLFCTSSGTWSLPAPRCEAMHCPLPQRIVHGTYIGEDITYGKSVLYICDAGYSLIGKHVVTCSLQGPDSVNWTELPKCKGCPAPSEIANGTHDAGMIDEFPYGSSVTYHCNPGYFLNGTATIHCLTSGTWDQPAPQCNSQQHNQMVQCCPPPYVKNGIHSSQETAVFTSGMSVKYKCEPGYTLTGEATVYCTASGTWSPSAPSCDVMHCPPPPSIVHGKYIGEDFTYGKTVIYVCDAGYSLTGENVVTCSLNVSNFVNWTEPPRCKGCPAPPGIPNGKHESEHVEDFPYGSSVTYHCNSGYFRSKVTMIHCLSSGTWSNPIPKCKKRQGKHRQNQQLGHEAHMQTGHLDEKKAGSYTYAAIGFGTAVGVLLLIVCGCIWLIVSKRNKVKYTPGNRKIYRGPEHQAEEQQNIPL